MFGSTRISAKSSTLWCVAPSPWSDRPQLEPTIADVQVPEADARADLVVGAARGEDGEGMDEGDLAAQGQPGGRGDHVVLGDAHLEVPLRTGVAKEPTLRGTAEVGLQGHDRARPHARSPPASGRRLPGSSVSPCALGPQGAQLSHGLFVLLAGENAVVEVGLVLGEGDSLALHRGGDDHRRLAARRRRPRPRRRRFAGCRARRSRSRASRRPAICPPADSGSKYLAIGPEPESPLLSTNGREVVERWKAAVIEAGQTWPSSISPSPRTQ